MPSEALQDTLTSAISNFDGWLLALDKHISVLHAAGDKIIGQSEIKSSTPINSNPVPAAPEPSHLIGQLQVRSNKLGDLVDRLAVYTNRLNDSL